MILSRIILFPRNISLPLRQLCKFRRIFSVDGSWEEDLTYSINKDIEKHWRDKINVINDDQANKEKFYMLSMFPYPSGYLHMGHVRVYTISDALARFYRMQGKRVIHPIGWDSFGLPAENAAISKNIHPSKWTTQNIAAMKNQLQMLNINFDWDMELSTCSPAYYKWTQYIFLLLYEKGLAYKKQALVNWDPVDETVLADEQVDENGCSWRSGCKVEKRMLTQWFLRTSHFAKSLYDGLSDENLVGWRDIVKVQQHWIGECTGFTFDLKLFIQGYESKDLLPVWSTTPELVYGASFVCIAPSHPLNKTELGGGIQTGTAQLLVQAIHPLCGFFLPVFVSDEFKYPESTDAILGIPGAKDKIIFRFAVRHELALLAVTDPTSKILINSEEFSNMPRVDARAKILEKVMKSGVKVYPSSSKLKDWLISRQRYWGSPIPVINCPKCKIVPVPVADLPVVLPDIDFDGKGSRLSDAKDWLEVQCPRCGLAATRETDTMDTFMDSSWYFLRYLDVFNSTQPFDADKIRESMPVDLYIGGKEHAVLHLFYARFMSHFFHSIGLLKHPEPFAQLLMQGMIHGKSYRIKSTGKYIPSDQVDFSVTPPVEKGSQMPLVIDWEKMSKSKFNGIDPEEVLGEHGIDTTRLFILGSVAPQSPRRWNSELFPGIWNWQRRIWLTVSNFIAQRKNLAKPEKLSQEEIKEHETNLISGRNYYVKKATHCFINTRQLSAAIAKLQGLTGDLRRVPKSLAKDSQVYQDTLASLLIMMAPLAPHFASELWAAFSSVATVSTQYDLNKTVLEQSWPVRDKTCSLTLNIRLDGSDVFSIPVSDDEMKVLNKEKAMELVYESEFKHDLKQLSVREVTFHSWPDSDADINFNLKTRDKKKVWKLVKENKAVNL